MVMFDTNGLYALLWVLTVVSASGGHVVVVSSFEVHDYMLLLVSFHHVDVVLIFEGVFQCFDSLIIVQTC